MTTNHLFRELAPISDAAWEVIETEAKTRLTTHLAARKLIDFDGPHGWTHSAVNLGHVDSIAGPAAGAEVRTRRVMPLIEVRYPFSVSRDAVDDAARGADDIELDELEDAARHIGECENITVFHGYDTAGITGITQASSHEPIALGDDFNRYPTTVARAVNAMRIAGIGGPYGLAIGPSGYTGIDGAVVLSLRGGDFQLVSGQDVSIGYLAHDAERVQLYLEESFTFRVIEPDAAVVLQ